LRLILATAVFDENVKKAINELAIESAEITKIIASIIVSTKKQIRDKEQR
jgi:hypothetical protein